MEMAGFTMSWRTLLVAVAVIGIALGGVACGDDDQDEVTPTIGAEGQITPTSGTEPSPPVLSTPTPFSGRRTGIPEVDAVVAAVESDDSDRVRSLLRYMPFPCEPPGSAGLAICRTGQEEGTPIDLFPIAGCELGMSSREDVDGMRLTGRGMSASILHEVYRAPPGFEPPAEYIAVFSTASGSGQGLAMVINQGQIVKIFFAVIVPHSTFCTMTPAGIVDALGLEEVIPAEL